MKRKEREEEGWRRAFMEEEFREERKKRETTNDVGFTAYHCLSVCLNRELLSFTFSLSLPYFSEREEVFSREILWRTESEMKKELIV